MSINVVYQHEHICITSQDRRYLIVLHGHGNKVEALILMKQELFHCAKIPEMQGGNYLLCVSYCQVLIETVNEFRLR